VSDSTEKNQKTLLERLKDLGLSSAATIGAFSSLANAQQSGKPQPETPLVRIDFSQAFTPEYPYALSLTLGGKSFFRGSLAGIAVDSKDRIYALGDEQVSVFSPAGELARKWRAIDRAACLTIGPDNKVWIGALGRLEIYDNEGNSVGGFPVGETNRPANVTSIKLSGGKIFAADAAARLIRIYDTNGKQTGELGTHGQPGFMLPNRSLDIAVDANGVIWATDPGRHRISSWNAEGKRLSYFGKFGRNNPADFVGCCNPVNIAILQDGKIAAGEKVAARVKVYDSSGKLLSIIGPENFDPNCTHLYLAADSKARIIVADPVRLEIKIFSPAKSAGVRGSL
jgi:hypothetical protein